MARAGTGRGSPGFPLRPARVVGARERLDEPGQSPQELEASLDHVAAVNRWLGGRRALLVHLSPFWGEGSMAVLDVGTGSADLPRAIANHARRRGRSVRIVAADLNPAILEIARARCADCPEVEVRQADALALPFEDGAFDVALLSLTLHHFDGGDQVQVLRELGRVARRGVIVSELERCWPNDLGARALAHTVWRSNPITRHDGPLSVRRAFTSSELLDLAGAAGLPAPSVHRHFFHRLILRASWPRGAPGVAESP